MNEQNRGSIDIACEGAPEQKWQLKNKEKKRKERPAMMTLNCQQQVI